MCLQTLLAAYIIVAIGNCTASAITDDKCQPAEEGQPYQMSYTLTTIPEYRKVLLWYKDGQLVSECPVEAGDCSNNDIRWLNARVVKRDEGIQFILNIENVTRGESKNAKGVWTLKTHNLEPTTEDMYICGLQVYAKAKDVVCESDLVTEGAIISCTTGRIYPEAMIDIYRDGQKLQAASCESYNISENPLYYKATCKIIIATEYLYVKQNNFNISIYPNFMRFMDRVLAGTVKNLTLQNGTTSQNQTALYVVTTLLIVAILLIVVLCVIYVKKCEPVRDVLPDFRYHFHKNADKTDSCKSASKTPATDIEARDKDDAETGLLADESKAESEEKKPSSLQAEIVAESSQTMEIKENDVWPDPIGISSSSQFDKETTQNKHVATSFNNVVVADKNMFKTTSSILLLGTQDSNKPLLKNSIIKEDYTIEIIQKSKILVDSKSKQVLLKLDAPKNGNFQNILLQDEGKIRLHYTKRGDQVIKLVDGPEFDWKKADEFIDFIKMFIVLSQEGYNAIIVAFTEDGTKNCNVLLNILHHTFDVDMNYVFPIFIFEKEYTLKKQMIDAYKAVEKVCGERLIEYNIENHTKEVNMLLSRISQMKNTCTRHLLCTHKENFQRYSKLEEILKEIKLLLDVCLYEPIPIQDEIKVQLDHVKLMWREYQDNYNKKRSINGSFNIESDQGETEGLVTTNIESGTKQKLEMDSNIIEDITHLLECLRYIYFGEESMKRCKVILMKSLLESYKHFHDWYVSSVTKDRDNLLDSNLKLRLSKIKNK